MKRTDLLSVEPGTGGKEEAPASQALSDLGQRMQTLRNELAEVRAYKTELQKEYDRLREEVLPDAMRRAGIVSDDGRGSFTLPDGATVYLRSTLYPSVRKANQPRFHAWLREEGHGDLIKETVHHQTLKAFCREQVEAGRNLPEDLVTTHYVTKASIRGGG